MIRTREDWILAGMKLLAEQGVDSIKIEAIARKLEVSKGGFYGYFLNRDTFLQAILDYWTETFTNQIIESVGKLEGSLSEKLNKMVSIVDDSKYDNMEISMLAWANKDTKTQKVVMRVIRERLEFITNLFRKGGFTKNAAVNRANIVHHYICGCRSFRPLLPKNGSPERYKQLDQFIKIATAPVT